LNGAAPQTSNHGSSMQAVGPGQGPSRLLPFRQQYGDGVDGS
jgi:hypothetical protein